MIDQFFGGFESRASLQSDTEAPQPFVVVLLLISRLIVAAVDHLSWRWSTSTLTASVGTSISSPSQSDGSFILKSTPLKSWRDRRLKGGREWGEKNSFTMATIVDNDSQSYNDVDLNTHRMRCKQVGEELTILENKSCSKMEPVLHVNTIENKRPRVLFKGDVWF